MKIEEEKIRLQISWDLGSAIFWASKIMADFQNPIAFQVFHLSKTKTWESPENDENVSLCVRETELVVFNWFFVWGRA